MAASTAWLAYSPAAMSAQRIPVLVAVSGVPVTETRPRLSKDEQVICLTIAQWTAGAAPGDTANHQPRVASDQILGAEAQPSPDSWLVVATATRHADYEPIADFSTVCELTFRRCVSAPKTYRCWSPRSSNARKAAPVGGASSAWRFRRFSNGEAGRATSGQLAHSSAHWSRAHNRVRSAWSRYPATCRAKRPAAL